MIPFYRSTIGKKVIMAVTGLIMVAWLLLHMAGNLQIFSGPEKLNTYAHFLHGPAAEVLWLSRAVLLVSVILHIWAAASLTGRKMAARPVGYVKREPQVSTIGARTIRISGVVLLLFIVFHILHFTTLTIDPSYVAGDVYANVLAAFHNPWFVAIYVVAMILLGLHLYHGLWSSVRTLGVSPASATPLRHRAAIALSVIIWLGFTIVPVAVFAGLVQ